jgi:transcriptional regulator with XRE-family HTH domain
MTQEEAAHTAGIDYKRWQRLEEGSVNPTVRPLSRAAEALGLSFWSMLRAKRHRAKVKDMSADASTQRP